VRTPSLPLLAAGGLLAVLAAITATPTTPATAAAPTVPLLVDVRAAHHPGFDRVVLEFRGGLPSQVAARYVTSVSADPSGRPVRIAGRALLQLTVSPAAAHDDRGRVTVRPRTAWALPELMTVVRAGDFEAVLTHGLGLASREPFRVWTTSSPPRVVLDVTAPRTEQRRVYLFDSARFAAGRPPFFVAVPRPVLPALPGTSLMHRLYAGPTPAEERAGLRLVLSGSTSFSGLTVSGGVARVRLVGGCRSGGSVVTVAGSVLPTLHQLPGVDAVKLLDPAGRTERPTGRTDSVPECLEP
jgi:hypothetical protein